MAIVKASTTKEYAMDKLSKLRVQSSGLKLTKSVCENLDLEVGGLVNYATEDGKLIIYTGEGNKLGKNLAFSSEGFKGELCKLANMPKFVAKNGSQLVFDIATEPFVDAEGELNDGCFELTFDKYIAAKDEEVSDVDVEDVIEEDNEL